jgi:hypothetical protein
MFDLHGMFNKDTPKKGERFAAEDAFPIHADPKKFFTPEYRKLTHENVARINSPIPVVQGEETSRLNAWLRRHLRTQPVPLDARLVRHVPF